MNERAGTLGIYFGTVQFVWESSTDYFKKDFEVSLDTTAKMGGRYSERELQYNDKCFEAFVSMNMHLTRRYVVNQYTDMFGMRSCAVSWKLLHCLTV